MPFVMSPSIANEVNSIFSALTTYQLAQPSYTNNVPANILSSANNITYFVDQYTNDFGDNGFRLRAYVTYNGSNYQKVLNYGYDTASQLDWFIPSTL